MKVKKEKGNHPYSRFPHRRLRIAMVILVSSLLAMLPVAVDKAVLRNLSTDRAVLLLVVISSGLCVSIVLIYLLIRLSRKVNRLRRKRESTRLKQEELLASLRQMYILQDKAYERELSSSRSTPTEIRLDLLEGKSAHTE